MPRSDVSGPSSLVDRGHEVAGSLTARNEGDDIVATERRDRRSNRKR